MQEQKLPLSQAERETLERVRRDQGLDDINQAAEWLAKTALRKAAKRTSGRGRALYPVQPRGIKP